MLMGSGAVYLSRLESQHFEDSLTDTSAVPGFWGCFLCFFVRVIIFSLLEAGERFGIPPPAAELPDETEDPAGFAASALLRTGSIWRPVWRCGETMSRGWGCMEGRQQRADAQPVPPGARLCPFVTHWQ